jgi:hypothetical protein
LDRTPPCARASHAESIAHSSPRTSTQTQIATVPRKFSVAIMKMSSSACDAIPDPNLMVTASLKPVPLCHQPTTHFSMLSSCLSHCSLSNEHTASGAHTASVMCVVARQATTQRRYRGVLVSQFVPPMPLRSRAGRGVESSGETSRD